MPRSPGRRWQMRQVLFMPTLRSRLDAPGWLWNPQVAQQSGPVLGLNLFCRKVTAVVGCLPKLLGFISIARVSDYAAGRLSRGREAPAFISQNAHGK
jgi:hypothetical protein